MTISKSTSDTEIPFFCVVTPVYDPTLESIKLLIQDLQDQTFGDFIHVLVSNGRSDAIKSYVAEVHAGDNRFNYIELEHEEINTTEEILANLGKRRNHVIKKYHAQRYIFADADLKIVRKDYFDKLFTCHRDTGKDLILTLVHYFVVSRNRSITLPVFPIRKSSIDLANITISRSIAEQYGYPDNYDPRYGIANDYRLFITTATEDNTIIMNFVSAIKNGNSRYKPFMRQIYEKNPR